MSDPLIAEVQIWTTTFAPRGWANCEGQTININTNTAMFSLMGTTYGGDGRTTFGFPDLRGRAPMHWGTAPGLTPRVFGQYGGDNRVFLSSAQLPSHTHDLYGDSQIPETGVPSANGMLGILVDGASADMAYNDAAGKSLVYMGAPALSIAGGGLSHENMQPYLTLRFCIAEIGTYPSRN